MNNLKRILQYYFLRDDSPDSDFFVLLSLFIPVSLFLSRLLLVPVSFLLSGLLLLFPWLTVGEDLGVLTVSPPLWVAAGLETARSETALLETARFVAARLETARSETAEDDLPDVPLRYDEERFESFFPLPAFDGRSAGREYDDAFLPECVLLYRASPSLLCSGCE